MRLELPPNSTVNLDAPRRIVEPGGMKKEHQGQDSVYSSCFVNACSSSTLNKAKMEITNDIVWMWFIQKYIKTPIHSFTEKSLVLCQKTATSFYSFCL